MKLPYLIAELSCNHEGDINELKELIDIAKNLKVNCVKIQSYTPDTISSNYKFKNHTMWGNIGIKNLYKMAHTPRDWHYDIIEYCKKIDIDIFTTVYSESDLTFTKKFNFNKYKIASFELSDLNLINEVSKNCKNIILSNGMSYFNELERAFNKVKQNKSNATILHCNSGYPAKFSELDLVTIPFLKNYFKCKIGFSDHTLFEDVKNLRGLEPWIAPFTAVVYGAEIIEFHLILDRKKSRTLFEKKKGGFDWSFSKEPHEVKNLIDKIKANKSKDISSFLNKKQTLLYKKMRGKVKLTPSSRELETLKFKPSLWTTGALKKGDKFIFGNDKKSNFDSLRPNNGLPLKFSNFIQGKRAKKNLKIGHPIDFSDIDF